MKQLFSRIIAKRNRRTYIRISNLLSDIRAMIGFTYFPWVWNRRLKIPRDARVNAFFAPAIKSNEN